MNIFVAEWRDKTDILSLRITEPNKLPLKIYEQSYLTEAVKGFKYENSRMKM